MEREMIDQVLILLLGAAIALIYIAYNESKKWRE